MKQIRNPAVRETYNSFPAAPRKQLKAIRQLVFEVAAAEDVGAIEETLKWGEPSYLTVESGAGSTIRLGWKQKSPDDVAIFLNCQTTLVDTVRTLFPELRCEGNRAILFAVADPLPLDAIRHCLQLALTYHREKKRRRA